MLSQAAGGAAESTYVEDVFSTYLYTGNGSTQTITNGIDLAGKGGLVWIKSRSSAPQDGRHQIFDTARGIEYRLFTDQTAAQNGPWETTLVHNLSSTGFNVGLGGSINYTGENFVSWTFRKQPKFFDVMTYTGNGNSTQTISHNLGSTPGCIIIKATVTDSGQSNGNWVVFHRSTPDNFLMLNRTDMQTAQTGATTGTSTTFNAINGVCNGNGITYVAYLFAHDAGGFGVSGSDNVISCGSVTTNGSGVGSVNLGWEPQWVLVKVTNTTNDWRIIDNMRGFAATYIANGSNQLRANTTGAESDASYFCNSTGFTFDAGVSQPFIYIAIRRGPMRTPTTGTSVYDASLYTGNNTTRVITAPFVTDLAVVKSRSGSAAGATWADRLRGRPALDSSSTGAEVSADSLFPANPWDLQGGVRIGNGANATNNGNGPSTYVDWNFRRAPGFFDVVCYTGNGSTQTINHNLTVKPELIIIKVRSRSVTGWRVTYSMGATTYNQALLESTGSGSSSSYGSGSNLNAEPTASVFSVGNVGEVNFSAATFVAYLFATVAGVSKVGSYTGNGSNQTINCGFTTGARFVLIKRTDSTGDWYVWDTARGIVSANDPHLSLNSTAAEVTTNDSIDPDNSGFIVNQVSATNVNVTSATYIYLAIA
jgi:hypothetical protein